MTISSGNWPTSWSTLLLPVSAGSADPDPESSCAYATAGTATAATTAVVTAAPRRLVRTPEPRVWGIGHSLSSQGRACATRAR